MEEEIKSKWQDILNHLKTEYSLTDVCFKTWLLPLKIHSINENDNTAIISVNDEEIGENSKDHIKKKYGLFMQVSIEEITGYHLTLEFKNKSELEATSPKIAKPSVNTSNKKNNNYNFSDKYTFDTFIVGSNNSFAHAASVAVAESPLQSEYNPLYIYGGSGLGKTHLMRAIAHYIAENSPELKVLYVTSEQYTNEIVEAIRNSKIDRTMINNIKNKYREVDVLMVDDVQFIIGRDVTQEEFFHTFNALYEQGKQIILTSDRHPNQMDKLDIRFKSRFNNGIQADVKAPEYETRLAILQKKNENDGLNLNEDILKFIAENIKTNIRDLEGAYNKLILRAKLQHCEITLDTAIEDIKDLILTDEKSKITNDYIINVIIDHYGLTLEEINSKNRSKNIANVRQICMYMCRKLTNTSYEEIGAKLGGKDRTTVMHGYNKIESSLKTDPSLQSEIDILKKIINNQ